jgi:hypothetical protein
MLSMLDEWHSCAAVLWCVTICCGLFDVGWWKKKMLLKRKFGDRKAVEGPNIGKMPDSR